MWPTGGSEARQDGWMDWRMDLCLQLSVAQDFHVEDQGQEHETQDYTQQSVSQHWSTYGHMP